MFVHRAVALCYIPNPHGYPDINHKDRNHENNQVSNLEWCTLQYNNAYTFTVGKPMAGTKCLLYKGDEIIGEFTSIRQAAKHAHDNYGAVYSSLLLYLQSLDIKIVRVGIDTEFWCQKWNHPYQEYWKRRVHTS